MADNLQLLKNIFTELQGPLFLGDGMTTGEFHALLQPGQFISTDLKENAASNDMAIQAELANLALDTSFIFKTLNGSVDTIYNDILTQVALPNALISAADQAEITTLTAWITSNQPAYITYQGRYFDALGAYNQEAKMQVPDPTLLQRLQQALNQARSDWQVFGQKNTYERNQARIVYLSEGDPATIFNNLSNAYANQSQTAPNQTVYQQTFLSPPVSQWNSANTSWGNYQKTINESDSYNYSSQTSWGGGAGVGWGLFSFGASASGSSSYQHSHSDVTTVSLAFDYMRVRIARPWLNSDVFNYRFWWWKKVFGYRLLSDGGNLGANPPVRPIGQLPFLPNYLIVVRNLVITSNFSSADATFLHTQLNSSASCGWGPFSISGSYSTSTTTQTATASFDGTAIRIAQPQIIAYTGTLMPLTPNPDRTLPWQGDQAPFDPPLEHTTQVRTLRRQESDAIAAQFGNP
jgi:hypothetical protein